MPELDPTKPVAEALAAERELGGRVERFASGSLPVYALGPHHALKLFPRKETAFFETEKAALARIDGSLSIPTPRLVAAGERDDWLYVLMTRLHGVCLADAWPRIDADQRRQLVRAVGVGLAELHALGTDEVSPLVVDWTRFIAEQRSSCRESQLAKHLAAAWADQVDDFLARFAPIDDGKRVFLHTEVMREHLLVEQVGDAWRLSGLVDFEPAMVGAPEYDLSAVGVFVTCAEPGLLRAFLDGYGTEPDDALPLRIMAYCLLHRYSNLRWYMERLPVGDANDLETLARRWFTP